MPYLRGSRGKHRRQMREMRSRALLGRLPGTTRSKVRQVSDAEYQIRNTRQLYTISTCGIPQGSNLNERERNIANIRGTKIQFHLQLRSDDGTTPFRRPHAVNVAVIIPKHNTTVNSNDFFRDDNPTTKMTKNWTSTDNWQQLHNSNINTQEFRILKHKRFLVYPAENPPASTAPASDLVQAHTARNLVKFNWWIPVNRQLYWDDVADTDPQAQPWLVFWGADTDAGTTATAAFRVSYRVITYFREPRN